MPPKSSEKARCNPPMAMQRTPMPVAVAILFLHAFASQSAAFGAWFDGGGRTPASTSDAAMGREYAALQAWKSAVAEDPSGILASWFGPDVCSYIGVYCSDPPEAAAFPPSPAFPAAVVSGIDLNHAGIRGSLVPELSLLVHLTFLHLNSNRFSGEVPESLSELRYLTELDLSNNQFAGPFPTATLLIPNLLYLDLRFNGFSGEVPGELFMKNLDAIFLNNNRFEGEIPMSLWASPASVITLANNHFSGSIPFYFGYMGGGSGIRELLLLNNGLTGCIPEGVGYLSGIEVIDLSFNSLTGRVPSSVSCLSEVEVLNLGHNRLSGDLPEVVCDLRRLMNLTVSYNFLSGFSADCARLFFRNVWFDFAGNCIPWGGMQRPAPECMGMPGGGLSCMGMSSRPFACGASSGQWGRMDRNSYRP